MVQCGPPAWPVPRALEGVKSKKRAIVKVDGDASAGEAVLHAAGLALTLESRVAAVGAAGRAAAAWLGAADAPGGAVWTHRGLAVAHLGPHLAGAGAEVAEHFAAVSRALAARPQVVLLDEALGAGSAAWVGAFRLLLRQEGLQGFGGAVVVCCETETFATRRVCSEKWIVDAGKVRREEAPTQSLQIVEDAFGVGSAATAGEDGPGAGRGGGRRRGRQQAQDDGPALLDEARELSEYIFEEDLADCALQQGWTVTLLAEAQQDGTRALCGYLCYRMIPAPRAEMHIERLAVAQRTRGRGHARQLMQWALEEAARLPPDVCSSLTCSAFDKVVPFYARFGFEVAPRPDAKAQDDEEPQTWMALANASLLPQAAS